MRRMILKFNRLIKTLIIVITFIGVIPAMAYTIYHIIFFDFLKAFIGILCVYVSIDVNVKTEV